MEEIKLNRISTADGVAEFYKKILPYIEGIRHEIAGYPEAGTVYMNFTPAGYVSVGITDCIFRLESVCFCDYDIVGRNMLKKPEKAVLPEERKESPNS